MKGAASAEGESCVRGPKNVKEKIKDSGEKRKAQTLRKKMKCLREK